MKPNESGTMNWVKISVEPPAREQSVVPTEGDQLCRRMRGMPMVRAVFSSSLTAWKAKPISCVDVETERNGSERAGQDEERIAFAARRTAGFC